jgi:multidrug transporter EmrE-like cation transporter
MPARKIIFGTLVGVISSATQSVGLTLQRKSHIQEDLIPVTESRRPPYKRPLWRLGFILFLIANLLGSSIQITTLPLIILSPLQAVGLVFNSVCSATILDEGFTTLSTTGTALVAFGALAIAGFGSIEEPNHSLDELLALMARPPFVLWIALSCSLVILLLIWISVVTQIHKRSYELVDLPQGTKFIRPLVDVHNEKFRFIKGCLYGVISGTLSAHSLLLAKSAVELLLNAILGSNYSNFRNLKCWLIIVSFFVLAITQLVFLNKGLRFVSTSVLYPLVFCIYNITNIISGLIFYNQLHILSWFQISMIGVGTVLVLMGVLSLSWRLEDHIDVKESSFINEHTSLMSPVLTDIERTGYVSFGSPNGEFQPKLEFPESNQEIESPKSIFRYGSIMDQGSFQPKGKRRSKRVLSYEQSELLNQLNQMDI